MSNHPVQHTERWVEDGRSDEVQESSVAKYKAKASEPFPIDLGENSEKKIKNCIPVSYVYVLSQGSLHSN